MEWSNAETKKVGYGMMDRCGCGCWKTVGKATCKWCSARSRAAKALAKRLAKAG